MKSLGVSIAIQTPTALNPEDAISFANLCIQVYNYSYHNSLGVSIAMQYNDAHCAEFGGCRVSSPIAMANFTRVLLNSNRGGGGTRLECVDPDDCSQQVCECVCACVQ